MKRVVKALLIRYSDRWVSMWRRSCWVVSVSCSMQPKGGAARRAGVEGTERQRRGRASSGGANW